MHWSKVGWDGMDTAWENVPKRGGGLRRLWMKAGTKSRIMFLDDDPTTGWEHSYKWDGHFNNFEPCVVRNAMGPECPMCTAYVDNQKDSQKKRYPYYIGLLTAISLSPDFGKNGLEYNFQRKIFAAKMGGKDKPGVLVKTRKLREKHGRLRGLVFDVERPGAKTEACGSEFDLVEKIDPSEIAAYGQRLVAEYVERWNKQAPPDKQLTVAEKLKRDPWEPVNFEEIYKPKSIAELRRMFASIPVDDDAPYDDGAAESKGGPDDADNDVPF